MTFDYNKHTLWKGDGTTKKQTTVTLRHRKMSMIAGHDIFSTKGVCFGECVIAARENGYRLWDIEVSFRKTTVITEKTFDDVFKYLNQQFGVNVSPSESAQIQNAILAATNESDEEQTIPSPSSVGS